MIDENKIKEAAKSLRKDFDDDVTQGFLVEFGFEKGAKWAITEFLKGSWHSIEEKPEKDKYADFKFDASNKKELLLNRYKMKRIKNVMFHPITNDGGSLARVPFDKIESWTDFGSCSPFSAALASSDVHGVFVPAASDNVRFDFSSGNLPVGKVLQTGSYAPVPCPVFLSAFCSSE